MRTRIPHRSVDIGGGDQFKRISCGSVRTTACRPSSTTNLSAAASPISIFESARSSNTRRQGGKFLSAPSERFKVLQWVHWQMANPGPMMGNANHFKNYAKNIADDLAQLEYGTKRFVEVDRLCGVMDAQLGANRLAEPTTASPT
jgi:hypothetical protein